MVQYHAWARGRPPSRQTNDMDCGVAARADSKLFARLTESLQTMGFQPVLHEAAHEYSWRRPSQRLASATVQVDLLLPTGLAADRHLSSTGSTGFASAGVQQATDRSERQQQRRQSGQASGPARGRSVPGTNSGSFKAQPHSNPGQLGL